MMGCYNHSVSLDRLQSRHQEIADLLVNALLSFLQQNRLPQQQYDLLNTPLIIALGANNSKKATVIPQYNYCIKKMTSNVLNECD